MPELDSYIIHRRIGEGLKASIAYGNQSIEDKSPSDYPYTGAWIPKFQQSAALAPFRIAAAGYQGGKGTLISDWSESEDPYTQRDLLDREEHRVQEIIFQIRRSAFIPYGQSLANKLLTLFKDAKEEDPEVLAFQLARLSIFSFLRYIQT
jgi:hypothetical protein